MQIRGATITAIALVAVAAFAPLRASAQEPAPIAPPQVPAPADGGQVAPPNSSKALEELLEKLQAARGGEALVAPTTAQPGGDVAPAAAPVLTARLRRAADSVQVVRSDGSRRDLAFWDQTFELAVGDEVRQDSGRACALLEYPEGMRARFDGRSIWRMKSDALARPRQFAIDQLAHYGEFTLAEGVDTVIELPGGNEVAGNGTRLTLHDHDRRAIEVRVSGPLPVVVRTPYVGSRVITVAPGQRIFLPMLAEPAAFVPHLSDERRLFDDSRGCLRVQVSDATTMTVGDQEIELSGRGSVPGIARACGARVVVRPGDTLRLTRAPIGFPRRQEQDE